MLQSVQNIIDETRVLREEINNKFSAFVDSLPRVNPVTIGLDPRACYLVWVAEDALIVRTSEVSTANYYWGFEYVDHEFVENMGRYTAYGVGDGRVADAHELALRIVTEGEDNE